MEDIRYKCIHAINKCVSPPLPYITWSLSGISKLKEEILRYIYKYNMISKNKAKKEKKKEVNYCRRRYIEK